MLNILASVLGYDIWFYVSHVLLHQRWLYKYHALHHAAVEPTFVDTYVGHVLEGPFQGLGLFVPMMVFSYSAWDLVVVLGLVNLRGLMRHYKRCVFLIGNHHLLHHKHPGYNFGEYWLDGLCGTRWPHDADYKWGLIYQ
jgi:lathosterol oxidase